MAKRLGEQLVDAGLVSAPAVEQALSHQKITGHRLGDCLVELGLIQEAALLRFLANELQTRFVTGEKLSKARIPPEVLDRVPVRVAEANLLLPLAHDPERKLLSLVMAEPQNEAVLRELKALTGMEELFAYVGVRSAVVAGIKKHYYSDPTAFASFEAGGGGAPRVEGGGPSPRAPVSPDGARPATGVSAVAEPGSRAGATQLGEALQRNRGTVAENDFIETLNILVGLIEGPRHELRGHSAQVARRASLIGRKLGLQPRELSSIATAAYLHDVGKRDDRHFTLTALLKNPELRVEAQRQLRAPIKLFETVHLAGAVNAVLAQLYEAFDGSGLPYGAKGDDIAIGARIIAVVDDFFDLTHNPANPFERLLPTEEAMAHLLAHAGTLFDPHVIDALAAQHSGEALCRRITNEGRQVVLAEPDATTRNALLEAFNRQGLSTHTVLKLEGVVDAIVAGEADAIVVSVSYGVDDVLALLGYMRARPQSAAVPVIVLGAPVEQHSRERLQQAGVTALVAHPTEAHAAATQVYQLLEDRIEHGAPAHVVRASFDELPFAKLIALLAQGRKSGRLQVRAGSFDGALQLERGRLIDASFGGRHGEQAVRAIASLPHAEFSYDPEAVPTELPQLEIDLEVIARELAAAQPAAVIT